MSSTSARLLGWNSVLISAVLLSGDAFVFPGGRVRITQGHDGVSSRRVASDSAFSRRPGGAFSYSGRPWRSTAGLRMASVSPVPSEDSDAEEDASATGREKDESAGADAGDGGAGGGEVLGGATEANAKESEEAAGEELDDAETTRLNSERMQDNPGLNLLAKASKGDSLPLSYRSDNGTRESEFYEEGEKENMNPYYDVVRRLSPTELIGRFMRTSSPRVQEAVRTTVLGLLGSLPRHAFETTAIATGDALANLMFQLQMTGYMFKNAEYRLSLQSSMRAAAALPPGKNFDRREASNTGSQDGDSDPSSVMANRVELDDDGKLKISRPKVSGKIKLTYDEATEVERGLEVDADAYMAELRGQVEQLEKHLLQVHEKKEEAIQKDLLMYIKSMPESQLQGLTAGVSPEVLEAMRLLVETVMGGMGNSEILTQTLTQQTGSSMAQLCMWQLVVGFNLREMEAREDLRKNFNK